MTTTFGQLLRRFRKDEAGLTQQQLANELYIARERISEWENDKYLPQSRDTILSLEKPLDLKPGQVDRLLIAANYTQEYGTIDSDLPAMAQVDEAKVGTMTVDRLVVGELEIPQSTGQETKATVDRDAALDRYCEWVKATYGTMRVLGKHEPVSVEGIYTDVYLLDRPQAMERFDLGQAPQGRAQLEAQRVRLDGIEVIRQPEHQRLVILGQPGAGKTTFLKHIALQAAAGKLGDSVPILVYLREWSGELMEFLTRSVTDDGIADPPALIEHLLRSGRALLLFDGLDEVNEPQRRDLIRSIEAFHRRYGDCRILLTCRVAATPHQFEGFSEVEVADFTYAQMLAFARNWFGENTAKTAEFQKQLQQDKHLRDLGRTPLLLGMLCLTFDEQGTFPQKRTDLYRQGLDALLDEWDASRSVEREALRRAEIYHNLSLGRKHQLFAYIAHATFAQEETLIPQERLERLITDYLVMIPDAPARIGIDAGAVLKAIEAQHGILVGFARQVYTFVHPTFQEYYTAHYIVERVRDGDTQVVPRLLAHAQEDRWREVTLLIASLLDEADDFFAHFLDMLDKLVCEDAKLVEFLTWAAHKAASVNVPYKPAAVRAYYASSDPDLALALDFALFHTFARAPARACDRAIALDRAIASALAIARDLNRAIARDRAFANTFTRAVARTFAHALDRARGIRNTALYTALTELQRPDEDAPAKAWDTFAVQLQAIMIEHRDIGHDWDFTEEQWETLDRYYTAAKLLVKCLDVAYVTDRAAIEERLLLPPPNLSPTHQ